MDATKHDSCKNLGEEDQRLMDRLIRDFKRNGLALPADKREQVKNRCSVGLELCRKWSCRLIV